MANLVLVPQDGIIGIDVDAYEPKVGAQTLADAESESGPLPASWRSTSRPNDPVSGIRWFKTPTGHCWRDLGLDVEVIAWHLRFAVVWPSVVTRDGSGHQYIWFNPSGEVADRVPTPDEFPDLPGAWVGRLARSEATGPPPPAKQTTPLRAETASGEATERGRRWAEAGLEREIARLATANGSRNDQLNATAYKFGRRVAGGLLAEATVREELTEASKANGLWAEDGQRAVLATIESGMGRGMLLPVYGPKDASSRTVASTDAWDDVDLGDLLVKEPEPIPRFGKGGLIYEGSLTWFYGDPSSGKSVLCYGWAMDVIRENGHVLLVDEETTARDVAAKFRALGLRPEHRARLHYLQPSGRNLLRDADRLVEKVAATGARLVIVDSASLHLTLAGRKENDNGDVADFIARALLPVARMRHHPAVVVIDHVVKSDEGRRWARGAGSKISAADSAFGIEVKEPFSKQRSGTLLITCHKDRFGEMTQGDVWKVEVTSGGGRLELDFTGIERDEAAAMAARAAKGPSPTKDAETLRQILEFVRANPGVGSRSVRRCVTGVGSAAVDRLVERAQVAGELRVVIKGNTHEHFVIDQPTLPSTSPEEAS
ncbi:AAA family ATPase [Nocardioides bizhenqiangii]|uniref:AAA family ATPase n=1 Tax=Nocardioides bizhenqiangii TaxID=3095076 RepID=A0ABZ0ZUN6_9ACTN|nr:AAA family ATPase [Nocardioides sp. HM61]